MPSAAKPVAIRVGALGDMLMFLPVLDALAARHQCDQIDVITAGGASAQILRHSPSVGEIFVVSGTRYRPLLLSPSKRKAKAWLQKKQPEHIYLFERKDKLLDVVKAAKVQGNVYRMAEWPRNLQKHQVDDYVDYVYPDLAQDHPIRYPRLNKDLIPLGETEQWLASKGIDHRDPLILVQAGNRRSARGLRVQRASNVKYWPAEHWAKVIDGLSEHNAQANFMLCGSTAEHLFNENIVSLCRKAKVHNLANELPLDRLMALAVLAHSMISVDTGPAHIAGALSCPLVVLFGPTSPIRHAPRSQNSVTIVTEKNIAFTTQDIVWSAECEMKNIQPESVIRAWQQTFS